jgi:iron-sulfur cluster assembly protein
MCIHLSEPAELRLRTLIRSRNLGAHAGIRVKVEDGGCAGRSYDLKVVAAPQPGDRPFRVGRVSLYIDPDSLADLRGVQVDFVEGVMESGFRFSNPQATGSCGCGKSFRTDDSCAPETSCHGH